ncbi:MAG TPA: methylmalonyl-CoA mutase family protein [Xanthobacteraceae bacterium]|nr:methylmalonyl-CoA mutase family protein [Xanthobacteraceae bacterium]
MTDPEKPALAGEFPQATREDWRKLVDAVLKGVPFERLKSKTYDNLSFEPLYGRAAGANPVTGRPSGVAWTLMQRADQPEADAANVQALADLENGATGLVLVFAGSPGANGFGLDPSPEALARVLEGVHLDAGVAIDLDLPAASPNVVRALAELIKSRGAAASAIDLRTGFNPIGDFAASGSSARSWNDIAPDVAGAVGKTADAGFRGPFAVADGRIIHNAGGSEAQELAFALASAIAYLRALEASGMALDAARRAIYFRLSADAEQFLTMAKFRALRKLWSRVEQACGLTPKPVRLAAETAWRMMSRRDPYVNTLRTTIAVAAAGLGGADSIAVLPHTAALGLPDAFARRLARNTQLLLLEESNLARVADPAAGSGALEAMTQALCTAAWTLLQEIEEAGGIWPALESGMLQRKVAAVRAERQKAIARRKDSLTGTNEFPNIAETAPAVLAAAPPASPVDDKAAASTGALPRIRLAELFERLREASDAILAKTGARPKIFLANLGTPAEFAARATFARNFFEAGGIEAVGDEEPDRPALAAAYKASGAGLACLCSSDKIYEREAPAAAQTLKAAGATHIYLAGRPGDREAALRAAGVQSFVYDGCDALATLRGVYDILASKNG